MSIRSQLLTARIRKQLPKLYANEAIGLDALAHVKFFTPDSCFTWYVSEFDGEDLFFGLVIGHYLELGYFSLAELQSIRGPLGLPVERDLQFESATLESLRRHYEQHGWAL
jgi:hypothetical protein